MKFPPMILLKKEFARDKEQEMKRVLFFFLVISLCVVLLAGCGTSTEQTATAINNTPVEETESIPTPEPKYQPPSDELVNGKVPYDNNYDYSSLEFDQVDSSCFSEV